MLEINQENLSILAEVSLDSYMYKTEHKLERQEEVLMEILSSNKNTEFGRQYKFEEILSAKQYASQVPVFEYADLKPYIERMKTEKNILFHDEICYWAMTSGTSGTHKYIPHTEKSLKNWYRGAFRAISSFIKYYPECNVPTLKCLTIVGPAILEKVGELSAGYISGIIPFVLEELRHINICNEKVNEIADYTEKMNMILKIAVRNPKLFAIGGISTFSIHFLNYARDHAYDVLKGEPEFVMIQQYFNEDHTLNLRKLWPEFQLFFSTGVSIEGYREQLKSMFPNLWIANVYAGTEGAYAFNKEQEEGLYLNFDLYYFEFREVEIGSVLSLNEVSIGKSYEVILTTHNGLYRYTNGDIVEFVSIDPPKIKVVGRSNLIMNLAGEKLSDSEVSQALQETDEPYIHKYPIIVSLDGWIRIVMFIIVWR